jgi:hypothetical protein
MIYDYHQFHISNRGGLMKQEEQNFLLSYLIKSYPINTGLTPSSNSTELWWTS